MRPKKPIKTYMNTSTNCRIQQIIWQAYCPKIRKYIKMAGTFIKRMISMQAQNVFSIQYTKSFICIQKTPTNIHVLTGLAHRDPG